MDLIIALLLILQIAASSSRSVDSIETVFGLSSELGLSKSDAPEPSKYENQFNNLKRLLKVIPFKSKKWKSKDGYNSKKDKLPILKEDKLPIAIIVTSDLKENIKDKLKSYDFIELPSDSIELPDYITDSSNKTGNVNTTQNNESKLAIDENKPGIEMTFVLNDTLIDPASIEKDEREVKEAPNYVIIKPITYSNISKLNENIKERNKSERKYLPSGIIPDALNNEPRRFKYPSNDDKKSQHKHTALESDDEERNDSANNIPNLDAIDVEISEKLFKNSPNRIRVVPKSSEYQKYVCKKQNVTDDNRNTYNLNFVFNK